MLLDRESNFIRSCNSIIARRWRIQAGQEITMWRGLFLFLLSVSQMHDSAAVHSGEYSLLLDVTSLSRFNSHQNRETTVQIHGGFLITGFLSSNIIIMAQWPNDLTANQGISSSNPGGVVFFFLH